MDKAKWDTVPELPDFMSVARVCNEFGVDKQRVYRWIFVVQKFQTVYKVVHSPSDERPFLLLRRDEVVQVMAEFQQEQEAAGLGGMAHATLLREWNKRVKAWGRDTGWTLTPIFVSGPPSAPLEVAYVAEHPDDLKPGS